MNTALMHLCMYILLVYINMYDTSFLSLGGMDIVPLCNWKTEMMLIGVITFCHCC